MAGGSAREQRRWACIKLSGPLKLNTLRLLRHRRRVVYFARANVRLRAIVMATMHPFPPIELGDALSQPKLNFLLMLQVSSQRRRGMASPRANQSSRAMVGGYPSPLGRLQAARDYSTGHACSLVRLRRRRQLPTMRATYSEREQNRSNITETSVPRPCRNMGTCKMYRSRQDWTTPYVWPRRLFRPARPFPEACK